MNNRILAFLLLFFTTPVWAIYDLVSIDISPKNGEVSFCFKLDTASYSLAEQKLKNGLLYLAATVNQELLFLSQENDGQLAINQLNQAGEYTAFQAYKKDALPDCIGPFSISDLSGITVYAGVGDSLDDVVQHQKYLPIFNGTQPILPKENKAWTVMVYMVGSDLEGSRGRWGSKDILEMLQGTAQIPAEALNLVVATGGSTREGWQTVKRSWIQGGQQHVLEDLGETSMVEPQTLTDFVLWGTQNFPAQRYALVLWNHGNGTDGFGLDTSPSGKNEHLSLQDLNQVYQNLYQQLGRKLDVITYDACLMGSIEVAEITRPFADVMTGSAELEPGHGLNYTHLLATLGTTGAIDGVDFGRLVKEGYIEQTRAMRKYETSPITYSVYDLTKLETFSVVFEEFAQEFNRLLQEISYANYGKLSEGMIRAPGYPRRQSGRLRSLNDGHIRVDLYSLLKTVGPSFPEFKEYAEQSLTALREIVVDYESNISHLEPDAGRISLNIGASTDYLSALPAAYQLMSQGMSFYNQRKQSDNFIPDGALTTQDCPVGFTCADIPNWLELLAIDDILSVSAYLGQTTDNGVILYRKQPLYQYQAPVTEEIKLPIDSQHLCRYQICASPTDCVDTTVTQQDNVLLTDINRNQIPALLSFCRQSNGDLTACGVVTQSQSTWGREDDLYMDDQIEALYFSYQNGQIQQATGHALTVIDPAAVHLRETCDVTQATVITAVTSLNDKPGYQQICTGQNCTEAGVFIRP